jgi:hypothetical protein
MWGFVVQWVSGHGSSATHHQHGGCNTYLKFIACVREDVW